VDASVTTNSKIDAFTSTVEMSPEEEAALAAAIAKIPDPHATQEVRVRLIALAKRTDQTGDEAYRDALSALQAVLRDPAAAPDVGLEAAFAAAPQKHADLERECEAAVVRWEWATGALHELQPLYFERHRQPRGRLRKSAPEGAPKSGTHAYGFDAEDRVRVTRRYNEFGFHQSLFLHLPGEIQGWHFRHSDRAPGAVTHYEVRDGLIVGRRSWARFGRSVERYEYEGSALRVIRTAAWDASLGRVDHTYEVSYDELDRLELIESVSVAGRNALWQRPDEGESLQELLPLIATHLRKLVFEALEQITVDEPVYALCLCMNGEAYDHLLPPMLGLGLASERDAFLQEHGAHAVDYLWQPPEWRLFDDEAVPELWDERMKKLCTIANQLIWEKKKYKAAFRVVEALAKELNAEELPLNQDTNFVVFSCDYTAGDGVAGVRRAAPAELKKRLRPLLRKPRAR